MCRLDHPFYLIQNPNFVSSDWFFISIFAIELLVLLVLACSSIACRNYHSGLVDRAPQDRKAVGGSVSVAKAQLGRL